MFVVREDEACGIECIDGASFSVVFIVQGDKELCSKWVHKQLVEDGKWDKSEPFKIETEGKACCYQNIAHRTHCIWMSVPPLNIDGATVFALIAHEALHAAYIVMDTMGMKPCFENEEWVAYFIQWIMNCYCQSIGVPCPITEDTVITCQP